MALVVVTGGSGRAGQYVLADLKAAGYEVRNVDQKPADEARYLHAELTDLGQTVEALRDATRVVHLAAIPSPGRHPESVVFGRNVMSTWTVLEAAEILGIGKLVLASSVNAVGLAYSQYRIQ